MPSASGEVRKPTCTPLPTSCNVQMRPLAARPPLAPPGAPSLTAPAALRAYLPQSNIRCLTTLVQVSSSPASIQRVLAPPRALILEAGPRDRDMQPRWLHALECGCLGSCSTPGGRGPRGGHLTTRRPWVSLNPLSQSLQRCPPALERRDIGAVRRSGSSTRPGLPMHPPISTAMLLTSMLCPWHPWRRVISIARALVQLVAIRPALPHLLAAFSLWPRAHVIAVDRHTLTLAARPLPPIHHIDPPTLDTLQHTRPQTHLALPHSTTRQSSSTPTRQDPYPPRRIPPRRRTMCAC